MSESADEIIERMQHVRRDVSQDVAGIVETAKTLTDWRYHVKHHPWMLVGGAVAVGFLLAPRKKKIPSEDAKELASLLKKYNVNVATPPGAGKSLTRTLLGMATPIVMRQVMGIAQQRFGGRPGPAGGMFTPRDEQPQPYEEINIPR